MTISAAYSPAQATGNGATVAFAYTFTCFDLDNLVVYLTNTTTDVDTLQVLNTDYTAALDSDFVGGTITFSIAPTVTERVTIYRNTPLLQDVDYLIAGQFPSTSTERALDVLTLIAQDLNNAAVRSLVLPVTAASGTSLILPLPSAGKVLQWNAGGTAIENSAYDLTDLDAAAVAAINANVAAELAAYLIANPISYDLVQDATPQLGGDLDVNGNDVVSVSNGDIVITPHGTGVTAITNLQLADEADGNNKGITATFRPSDSQDAAQTFALADAGRLQRLTGSTNRIWTIPANTAVAFVTDTEIEVFNDGTAELTLTADTGVTVNGVTAGSIVLPANNGGVLKKVDTNRWIYMGDLKEDWA